MTNERPIDLLSIVVQTLLQQSKFFTPDPTVPLWSYFIQKKKGRHCSTSMAPKKRKLVKKVLATDGDTAVTVSAQQRPSGDGSTKKVVKSRKRPRDDDGAAPAGRQQELKTSAVGVYEAPAYADEKDETGAPAEPTAVAGVEPATTSAADNAALRKERKKLSVKLWAKDPLYRIIRALPRSDVVHIVKCKLKEADCLRGQKYIHEDCVRNEDEAARGYGGLKELRLQVGCPMPMLKHFEPTLRGHRYTLRKLDLSRNVLKGMEDIDTLVEWCDLGNTSGLSNIEMLDVSYNPSLGDQGVVRLMSHLSKNDVVKAVITKHCGVTDAGCVALATFLAQRPVPRLLDGSRAEPTFGGQKSVATSDQFLLNLNNNMIGALGIVTLRRWLPDFVSLTLSDQRILPKK